MLDTLTVVVRFDVIESHLASFVRLVREHAYRSRTDEGCLQYDILLEENGSRVWIIERWASASAFEAHQGSQHLAAFRRRRSQLPLAHEAHILRLDPGDTARGS